MYRFLSIALLLLINLTGCKKNEVNQFYKSNPEPLLKNAYIRLPLGSVKPEGWLKDQLNNQAAGLTGNLDDFWPDLKNSAWRGGEGESWERAPYYLDGLIPLAYLLDNKDLIEKSKDWVSSIIKSSSDTGWYGPSKNKDRWPLAVTNKVLMQYYEATGDTSALNVLVKYFRYLHDSSPDWPNDEWRGVRAMENAVTGYWLYRQTNEPWILETIKSIQDNSFDWTSYYEKFPWDSTASANKLIPLNWKADGLTAHVVNNAMAIKYPGLWYQQSKDGRYKNSVSAGIEKYDLNHGQTGGRFSGDEHLSGKSPDRGTELCSVVEYMFSLEELYAIFGDNKIADRLELLTFNSLPGSTTADMWAHQYDQQSNQVSVTSEKREWSTNGENSNIYGLMPNFACCLANMHQGWPKFTENLWMATNDNGLVAVAYSPSAVSATVGNGTAVKIEEITDYPFKGKIKFVVRTNKPVRFPLYLRIPGWADSVSIKYNNKLKSEPGGKTVKLIERWHDGDSVILDIPLKIRIENRFNNSISLLRGPLYFSLRIDKEFNKVKINNDNFGYKGSVDWEINALSPWNYGLMMDKNNMSRGVYITENKISKYPFADKGDMIWSDDSSKYFMWKEDPPVVIKTRGIKIPEWKMKNNSADIPPPGPIAPEGEIYAIELIPYGSAKLRITEFPIMNIVLMEDTMRPAN